MRAVDTDVYTWRTWSDCVLVTAVSHAKTAEPIEMPYGDGLVWTPPGEYDLTIPARGDAGLL